MAVMRLRKKLLIILGAAVLILVGVAAWVLVNPIELVRQARDRQLEASAGDFLAAAEYYYKSFYEYPWDASTGSDPSEAGVEGAWLQELVGKEIVSASFARRSHWNQIYVTRRDSVLYACFAPLSHSFKEAADLQKRWQDGSTVCDGGCFSCLMRQEL